MQDELTVLITDHEDPPCMDYYTNAATPLHDAYLFFPMMYNHFPEALPWDPKDFSFASSFHASFLFSINQFIV